MREIRQSGSEGGARELNRVSLPLSNLRTYETTRRRASSTMVSGDEPSALLFTRK